MKNKFFEKAFLMQDDELLATFHFVGSESFSIRYKYEAEEGFADFRLALEKAMNSEDREKAERELFQGVWLVDAETFEVSRDFLMFITDESVYVRPRLFASTYELKHHNELLARLASCEDVADRRWWYVCKFHPNRGFRKYEELFLEASALLNTGENPQRVKQIYSQLKADDVVLIELRRGEEAKQFTDFKLRFNDDRVYICIVDCE